MAVTESWVLDGLDISAGNFQILELTADPPKAKAEYITAADSEWGALLREPKHENRELTFKLRVTPQASMDAAFDAIAALRDKLVKAQRSIDGIGLVWTPANSTRSRTFDALFGEITELPIGIDGQARSWLMQRPIFTLVLTTKPYWEGTETLTSTASSATPFVTLEVPNVTGDVPALGRLIVTDAATQSRRHVEWGLESQYYTPGSPTSLLLDSDGLVLTGFAGANNAIAGAYDPNATGGSAIQATAIQAAVTAVCGTGNQSHVGVFRVKARAMVSAPGQIRLVWRSGDGPMNTNSWASLAVVGRWEELDLGTISITPAIAGTQRWTGQIEALAATSTASAVSIDYLILIPAGEGYGKARAFPSQQEGAMVAYDEFTATTAGGALNTRVAPIGGTWATSGDATDFIFADDLGGESVKRANISDTATGRFAVLGSNNYTDTQTEVVAYFNKYVPFGSASFTQNVLARYVDANNFLMGSMNVFGAGVGSVFVVSAVVAGVSTELGRIGVNFAPNVAYRLRLVAYATGRVIGAVAPYSSSGDRPALAVIDTNDTRVATAGALASGKPGFRDVNPSVTDVTRWYDLFSVVTPAPEPLVISSTRTMQIRHDATVRVDSTNTYYGAPASYRGTRFTVPPGTSRVLVKARRWDVEAGPDTPVTDNTTVQIGWTQRGLVVPR